jgi:exodeoxyribonuclease VII large subunit
MGEPRRDYPSVPEGTAICSVTKLTEQIRMLLEQGFDAVWVEGEIANVSRPASGHIYLTLRDSGATIPAVIYRGQAMRLPAGFELGDGQAVIAFGRISVYAPRGAYQLIIERLHPKGVGAAELALRELREKLNRLGYFDPRRKRPLPRFPRSVCLIASATGAAVRDMVELLRRRWPSALVLVRPSRVQGEGAAEEIAAAIEQVNRWHAAKMLRVDAILIGRGGGSAEDLAAFDTEVVARAIFQSGIPIVSAVGHEIDISIADLVADVRAATPSHAAELTTPDRSEVIEAVSGLGYRLDQAMQRRFMTDQGLLEDLAGRLALRRPSLRIRELERRLDEQAERLTRAIQSGVNRARREVEAAAARLESLSPLNVLARGYSLTQTETGRTIVRSPQQVAAGDRLITTVQHGRIISRVEASDQVTDNHG